MKSNKKRSKSKENAKKKIEWAFKPTLGYKIDPKLTRLQFEEFLTCLSVPIEETSDSKKKET